MVGEGTAGGEETCWVNRGGGEKKEKGCMCGRNKVGNYIVGLGGEVYREAEGALYEGDEGGLT